MPSLAPNRSILRRFWFAWGLAFGAGIFLVGLASLPPFLSEGSGNMVRLFFSSVCHQLPERSPSIGGVTLAVCHRCYGIYWGLPLAALAIAALRNTRLASSRLSGWLLGASVIPIAFDWTLDALGWLHNTPWSRWITGLLFGLVAGWYFVRAILDAARPKEGRAETESTQEAL